MKIKFDKSVGLTVASLVLGAASLVVSNLTKTNDNNAIKETLKKELLDELGKK